MKTFFGGLAAALLLATSFASVEARDMRVKVVNNSHHTMWELYGSNRDRTGWENDIFGNDTLSPHSSFIVDFEDYSGYCIFDVKAVWADGHEHVVWGANICELRELTFTYR